jgi:CheY-like chemotaxis protein
MIKQRVLVVEDDEALRYAMTRELTAAGYEVAEASDYRKALDVLEDGKQCAVLVVDVILPQVNGFALARMARLRHPYIKAVYMTGFDNIPVDEANGPVLHKPIASEVLLATVAAALRGERHGGA